MSDSETKPDVPSRPREPEEWVTKEQFMAVEKQVEDLARSLKSIDVGGTRAMARLSDQITATERARTSKLDELISGVRRLDEWTAGVDLHFETAVIRNGEVAQKVEDLWKEMRDLQGLARAENGRTEK